MINHNKTNENDGGGRNNQTNSIVLHSHAYKVNFVNSSPLTSIIPEKALSYYNNYIIGNDPKKWTNNCKIFQMIGMILMVQRLFDFSIRNEPHDGWNNRAD